MINLGLFECLRKPSGAPNREKVGRIRLVYGIDYFPDLFIFDAIAKLMNPAVKMIECNTRSKKRITKLKI